MTSLPVLEISRDARATSPPKPYKLMRVITRLNIGGPAIHTILLTRELASLGYQTTLVTGVCEASDGDMSYLLETGDSVSWVPEMSRSVSLLKNLRAAVRLWRLMRAEHPDIVHTHTAMAGCLGRFAALCAGVPVVVHTFHGNSLRDYFSPLVSRSFLAIERFLARSTDKICVLSKQQLAELSGDFQIAPEGRFRIVPLGLDLAPFAAIAPSTFEGGRLQVGWFGRLVPVKNVPLLIRVIESTLQRTDSVDFHVAGDGPDREILAHAARRFGSRLVWHGWQRNLAPLIARCHVLLQTSTNEGTPVALIQGMAGARPFLSTPVGGVVDMVFGPASNKVNGGTWHSNGALIDADPDAFASALHYLLNAPGAVAEMGRHARLFALERHEKQALVANLDSMYRELLQLAASR